jgi:MFS family permease
MSPGSVLVAAVVTALAAAIRSTWSPCGLSMLSAITPMAERGRHRRYGRTAGWFIAGGVLGGATAGGALALAASLVAVLGPGPSVTGVLVAIAAVLALVLDTGIAPPALPHHRRQVNERWLDRYRGWATGAGYGWQIGTGVVTYIMTASLYLTAVLAALTASPLAALALGTAFGLVRGLAILLVAGVTDPTKLARFHRRFDEAREPVRWAIIGVEVAVAVFAAALSWGTAVGLGVVAVVGAVAVTGALRTSRGPVATDRRPVAVR